MLKKRIKRIYFSLVVSIMILLTLVFMFIGIRDRMKNLDGNKDSVQYLIGVSQANLAEPWRIEMNKEIRLEVEKNNSMKVVFTDAAQDSKKQIADVRKLLDLGIDLLMISPNDAKALSPVISEAYKQVPVIVLDREIENDNYSLFIGANNKEIGYEAGQLVLDLLGENGGNVLEIQGDPDSILSRERSEGFLEAVSRNENIKIVDTIVGDWMRDKTEDILKEIITGLPDISIVFAHNDEMAMGAYVASNKMRIEGIKFIGIGGLPTQEGGIELVRQGILEATFTNVIGGKEAIQYALKILEGENDMPKKIILKSRKVTKDTIENQ